MVLKKYKFVITALAGMVILYFINNKMGKLAVNISYNSLIEMLFIIPPVFIILGLLDVWVPKQTMVKYLGIGSGLKGIIIAFVMGSAAAGPLYGAFPIAAVLIKKGAKFFNVLIFIGAWSTTKIPMFMFEIKSLGARFAVTRLVVDIIGIVLIAGVITKLLTKNNLNKICENAKKLS